MALRYEATERIDKVQPTPSGGLRIEGNLARTGVFTYRFADGTVRKEYRPAEEVFHPDSLRSYTGATVAIDHPDGMVDPSNWKQHAIGTTLGATKDVDGKHVYGRLDVNDADAIARIRSGELKEISCGYECAYDPTPGVSPEGEHYDGIQRDIRQNHVSLGKDGWGRQGSTVALRLDAAEAVTVNDRGQEKTHPLPSKVMKQTIDGIEYTVGTPEHTAAVSKMLARLDAAEKEITTTKADLVTAKAETAKAVDPKLVQQKIAQRVKLVADAKFIVSRARLSRDDATAILAKLDAAATEDVTPNGDDAIITEALKSMNAAFDPAGMSHEALLGALKYACTNAAADEAAEDPMGQDKNSPSPMAPNAPPAWDAKDRIRGNVHAPRGKLGEPRQDGKEEEDSEEAAIERKARKDSEAWKPEVRAKAGRAAASSLYKSTN